MWTLKVMWWFKAWAGGGRNDAMAGGTQGDDAMAGGTQGLGPACGDAMPVSK